MSDAIAAVDISDALLSCFDMIHEYTVATGATIYQGSGVALNGSGLLVHASDATAKKTVGRAEATILSAAAGVTLKVRQGIVNWNAAGSGTPVAANRWQICYWADDQTITMTPGTLVAGLVYNVDTFGVKVLVGLGPIGESGASSGESFLTLNLASTKAADAGVYYLASPIAGTITNLQTILNAALATGNATATVAINGTNITGGVVTMVQASSAAGQVNSAQPTALNTIAVGDQIKVTIGGTSTATGGATLTLTVARS
jgi:hypothetical protein